MVSAGSKKAIADANSLQNVYGRSTLGDRYGGGEARAGRSQGAGDDPWYWVEFVTDFPPLR